MGRHARRRALGFGAIAAAALACEEDLRVDLAAFCAERPDDLECGGRGGAPGPAGAAGGAGAAGASEAGRAGAAGGGGGAGAPACAPPAIECEGACVGPNDCVACEVACDAGGACAPGECGALAVATQVAAPYALALDATDLYVASPVLTELGSSPPAVRRVARRGGPVTPVYAAPTVARSRWLALEAGRLFFGNLDATFVAVGPADGGAEPAPALASEPAVQHFVAAGGRLWWSTFDGASRVRSAPDVPAVAPADVVELAPATQAGRVPSVAAEGSGQRAVAYWVNPGTSTTQQDNGLWRCALDGVALERLVAGGSPFDLALSEDAVFVADARAGIGKAQKAGPGQAPAPVVAAADVGGALQGIAVAAGRLYWLAFDGDRLALHRSALDGSGARVVGRVPVKSAAYWSNPLGPARLVVDGGFVYFADPGTLTGNTQDDTLNGVAAAAADGAVYRLPQ